jgi:phosphatidylinositol alpha-1,6-mannosyltransferase
LPQHNDDQIRGAMRILMLTRNFPPLLGGMERLLFHAYVELRKSFDVDVVGPAGCEAYTEAGSLVRGCRLRPLPLFLLLCYARGRKLARVVRPDLILAGSGLTALPAVLLARALDIPAVTVLHGLDLVVNHGLYQRFFVPAIRRCDVVIVNSRNTGELARHKGIDPGRIRVLNPGVTLPDPQSSPDAASFRAERGIGEEEIILLSVGRLTRRKGLAEFVEKVLPGLVGENPRFRLLIVGGNATRALRGSGNEQQRITAAAARAGLERHVTFLGAVSEEELSRAYASARCLVFPVLDLPDDVEGFGMVAAAAAAHGLPTIAFAAGGVPDAVASGVSGTLVPAGDYEGMAKAILENASVEVPGEVRARCRKFAERFAWDRYGAELNRICQDALAR